MRACTRLALNLLLLSLAVAISSTLLTAQIHGVAPSVTSFGFGGSNNPTPGTPASVTSVGPNGFFGTGCCFGPLTVSPRAPRLNGPGFTAPTFEGRRFHDHLRFPVGVMAPAYIPYPVPVVFASPYPYADYEGEDDSVAVDPAPSRELTGLRDTGSRGTWARERRLADRDNLPATRGRVSTEKPVSVTETSETAAAVPAQPATMLIYADGHTAEVQNYAIVGNTLFEFSGNLSRKIQLADLNLEATRKANEDRGVEFLVPAQKSQ